jgi:hypothetical protein
MGMQGYTAALASSAALLLVAAACGPGGTPPEPVRDVPSATTQLAPSTIAASSVPQVSAVEIAAISAAVTAWLAHLSARNDPAAFADLAPRSQAAVGDVSNYERGSGRFDTVYAPFSGGHATRDAVLTITDTLAVVTLSVATGSEPALAAVPVRRVGARWKIDPILDAGGYTITPADSSTVSPQPTITIRLDDRTAHARTWFDTTEAPTGAGGTFRAPQPLASGWHAITVVILRGDDIVSTPLALYVT